MKKRTDHTTILDALRHHAESNPTDLAFSVGGSELSFGSLRTEAERLARSLTACGLTRAGRCALVFPTGIDLIELILATQLAGGAPVVLNPLLPPEMMRKRLELLEWLPSVTRTDAHEIRFVGKNMVEATKFLNFVNNFEKGLEP